MVPVIDRLLNGAMPEAFVATVVVPPRVPLLCSVAVTSTPACGTGLFAGSRSWITGCCGNTVPPATVAEGWVVIASVAPAPALRTIVFEVTGARPPLPKRSV